MTDIIASYFAFSDTEIILLSVFCLFFLIHLFYYLFYYRKPYSYVKARNKDTYEFPSQSKKPKVSVIISSENEAIELKNNLPAVLEQDYPDFEVIVVNNGSTDESYDLLQSMKLSYSHLYHTYVPCSPDKDFDRRKLALTIGIKAAKGDVLLFTEPYSIPASNKWISSMMDELTEDKEIVLGFSFFKKTKNFFNRIARFDNLLFSLQYLSMAIKGKPFTGTYRNIAFRKHLFFDNKGFASYLSYESGEDVFINHMMTVGNTAVAICQDSFIETGVDRYSLWRQMKKSFSMAKAHFKGFSSSFFRFETFSRYIYYLIFIVGIAYSIINMAWGMTGIFALLFVIKLVIQASVINNASRYFQSGKFRFSFIIMDLLQPLYNLNFRTRQKRLGKK